MSNFKHKGKIINTNVIDFKQRYFLLDDYLIGLDKAIIGVFEDGYIEMLYLDCENPSYSHSDEQYDLINIDYEFDRVINKYKELYGDDQYLGILTDQIQKLSIDLSILDSTK